MLPSGQTVQHAAKAGSPQHDIHVVMRLNAPSMALSPHFCDMLHGSIEKGGEKTRNPKSKAAPWAQVSAKPSFCALCAHY